MVPSGAGQMGRYERQGSLCCRRLSDPPLPPFQSPARPPPPHALDVFKDSSWNAEPHARTVQARRGSPLILSRFRPLPTFVFSLFHSFDHCLQGASTPVSGCGNPPLQIKGRGEVALEETIPDISSERGVYVVTR